MGNRGHHRGDCLFTRKWKLTVDPLCVDHWPPPPNPPRINRGNCLFMWKWKLTVDHLHVNHQPSPPPPPRSTEAITFSHKSESWLLILSVSIVNPPPDQHSVDHLCVDHLCADCWSPLSRLSIDPPTFLIFNIRIYILVMVLYTVEFSNYNGISTAFVHCSVSLSIILCKPDITQAG